MKQTSEMKTMYGKLWLWRFLGGVMGGVVGAVLAGVSGRFLGDINPTGWSDLVGTLIGVMLGVPLGVTGGIALASRWTKSPFAARWVIPAVVIIASAVLLLAEPLRLNRDPRLLFGCLLVLPALTAAAPPPRLFWSSGSIAYLKTVVWQSLGARRGQQ